MAYMGCLCYLQTYSEIINLLYKIIQKADIMIIYNVKIHTMDKGRQVIDNGFVPLKTV